MLLCLTCLLGGARTSMGRMHSASADTTDWSTLALRDLAAIRSTIESSHPGAVDEENPDFRQWLERGYEYARMFGARTQSQAGYRATLKYYVYGFQDGHVSLQFEEPPPVTRWPGFLVEYDHGDFVVAPRSEEETSPPVGTAAPDRSMVPRPPEGAVLLSCDGRTTEALSDEILRRFQPIWSVPGARPEAAPYLFVDRGNPFADRPEQCVFSYRAGEEQSYRLQWRQIPPEQLKSHLEVAQGRADLSFELRRFGSGGYWISIPGFAALDDREAKDLTQLLYRVKRKVETIRNASVLVLDVRGNHGGASVYGLRLASLIWSSDYVDYAAPRAQAVDWRVSKTNLEYVRQVLPILKDRFGAESDVVKWWKTVRTGMKEALEAGTPYFREETEIVTSTAADSTAPAPVSADVFLLTDSRCFSACLGFADIVLQMPGVVQVGRRTSADTPYVEATGVLLPSKRARLGYPMKVNRGRVRARNEGYIPSPPYRWTGSINNTPALERWIWGLAQEQ